MQDKIAEEIINQFGVPGLGAIVFILLIAQYAKVIDFFNQISQVSNAKLKRLQESLDNSHINPDVKKQLEISLNELTFKKMTGFHLTNSKIKKANQIFEVLEGRVLMGDICRGIDFINISSDNKISTSFLSKSAYYTIMQTGVIVSAFPIFIFYYALKNIDFYKTLITFDAITILSDLMMFLGFILSAMQCYKVYLINKSIVKIESMK